MRKNKNNFNNSSELSLEARLWLKQTLLKAHPEWVDKNGNCHKCNENYSDLSNLEDAVKQVFT